jgi:hypothetical protein
MCQLQATMDELDKCGYAYLTAAIRAALLARFRCVVCHEKMPGRLSQVCYCPEGAINTHHISRCCREFGPGRTVFNGQTPCEKITGWILS